MKVREVIALVEADRRVLACTQADHRQGEAIEEQHARGTMAASHHELGRTFAHDKGNLSYSLAQPGICAPASASARSFRWKS